MHRSKPAFFRRSPWLTGIPRTEVDALIARAETVALVRSGSVWEPDDAAARLYWVRSGLVRVERMGDQGRRLILRFHGRGDVFGVAALFSKRARSTRAVCHQEAVVYGVPVDAIEHLASAHGAIGMRLSDLLIERQRRLEARLAGLVFRPVRDRLLSLFGELATDFGVRDSRGVILDVRLTHREMSAMIGTTRESVSLALVRLRREGWLAIEDKRVVVLRPRELGVHTRNRRRDRV